MDNEIEKPEQPSPDDVLAAIQSFNDPNIIINLFQQLGWSYSVEIKETIILAQQNANMSIKFKAIKYLRELFREAAETAGYTANVSQTMPNTQGGYTTFHAKRIANILNPTKQIESTFKESQNDQTKETQTEPNRGSDRRQDKTENERDTERADTERDVDSGGTESSDGEKTPRRLDTGREINSRGTSNPESDETDNPCIKTRPPTCNQDLFPGIASAG